MHAMEKGVFLMSIELQSNHFYSDLNTQSNLQKDIFQFNQTRNKFKKMSVLFEFLK